eukprot:CAMPEP_0118698780 /NCGR_PEP_ID=MMETSP0800-20121206/15430_1 /TAXON_ID=210618 ORGANISM="Striatella unipunctata, Strain CCMP2910" /NCGR_SAMPLE_ID=MMETSP0800 /ASSEMBLY_ACC=CAM_ASM_000638 /LENGTH=168 /DNA_ID=CAMNT_0006598717 /DNA_START=190 /DNA_END=696 /DNA_ORIENTATION=+
MNVNINNNNDVVSSTATTADNENECTNNDINGNDSHVFENPIDYSATYLVESISRLNDSASEAAAATARQREAAQRSSWHEFAQQYSFDEERSRRRLRDSVKLPDRVDEDQLEEGNHDEFGLHQGMTSFHSSWGQQGSSQTSEEAALSSSSGSFCPAPPPQQQQQQGG